jgi:hypothetical protein
MTTLGIVACGATKIWDVDPSSAGMVKARDAYVSAYARWKVRYAERFFDRWVILSGKYGFLDPDTLIENYDVRIKDRERTELVLQLWGQVDQMNLLNGNTEVKVLGGKEYQRIIKELFGELGNIEFEVVCEGLAIGKAIRWLKHEVERVDREAVDSFMKGVEKVVTPP